MLVLTRREDEEIVISLAPEARKHLEDQSRPAPFIKIKVVNIQEDGNQVKIGFDAPPEFIIARSELLRVSKRNGTGKKESHHLWQKLLLKLRR